MGYILGVILGLSRDNGKENGNYYITRLGYLDGGRKVGLQVRVSS